MKYRSYGHEIKDVTPKSDLGWLVLAHFLFIVGVGLSIWGAGR